MMAFPDILLAIALVAVLGPSLAKVILALAIVYTPRVARVVRASTLVVRELPYVEAARALGVPTWRIMTRHVLRNLVSPILVQGTFIFAYAMLAEAGLSFLGVGVSPEMPTWGTMIAAGRQYVGQADWMTLFPGIAIVLCRAVAADGRRRHARPPRSPSQKGSLTMIPFPPEHGPLLIAGATPVALGARIAAPSTSWSARMARSLDSGPSLSPPEGVRRIEAQGAYVSPGWTDLHAHVWYGGTDISIRPSLCGVERGVTTIVDAGSAGEANFHGFREYVIEPARERIKAFLNIGSIGLVACNRVSELIDMRSIDLDRTIACVEANRDVIIGIKVRASGVILGGVGHHARAASPRRWPRS